MPDGSSQPAEQLTLRLTEVTVGTNGPAAMPAPLPPTSAYTFCADFGADEAASVGARSIRFNQPVWGYVDNFIGLPVGTLVPNGYYDREKAAWVPQENGLAIEILGVSNGQAEVDLIGGGVAADNSALAAHQFSSAELQHLAATYAPGSTLWRMPLMHFSFIDWNAALPTNNLAKPNTQPGRPLKNDCDKCPPNYGTANFTSQVFEEAVPLVGVPMALHYSSARVPDYRELAQAVVPLLPTTLPGGILGVSVRSEIAGVAKDLPYALTAGSSALVSWDGYDAYGRFVGGSRDANIEVTYSYPITYALTPSSGSRRPSPLRQLWANQFHVWSAPGAISTRARPSPAPSRSRTIAGWGWAAGASRRITAMIRCNAPSTGATARCCVPSAWATASNACWTTTRSRGSNLPA